MFATFRTAARLLVVMTLLTGLVYPIVITWGARLVFPHASTGSLVVHHGQIVGSSLVGQAFTRPEYFWGRLSATSGVPYNAAASSGSNLGPLHPALISSAKSRMAALCGTGGACVNVPIDLVTSSASGLDPHITPAAAAFQIPRVAAARRVSEDAVRTIVERHVEGRQLLVFGEPRVNVLLLNLDLDQSL